MLELESLNVNQRHAVDWNEGPMLVLAGPGAGKTRVLTTRVFRLIQGTPDKRFRVLTLTFTTKAAEEMRGRAAHLLGPNIRRARLTTFHGLTREIRHQLGADPPLGQFLQQIDLRQKTPPPRPTHVQCLTIHLAKGKEFQHVYLTGLVEEQLPSYQAVQGGSSAMEEERRSCFVAITRVQCSLTLTHADSYFGWPEQPSRFLAEMGLHAGSMAC